MKKFFLAFFLFALNVGVASAANDCPFGLVNDPAPGDCSLYVDKNGDYTCDHSETELAGEESPENAVSSEGEQGNLSEDEMKLLNVSEVADFFKIDPEVYRQELSTYLKKEVKTTDSLQVLHDNDGLCAGVAAGMAASIKDQGVGGGQASESTLEQSTHDLISGQELKTKTVGEVALIYGVSANDYSAKLSEHLKASIKTSDSFQVLHDNYDLSPSTAKDIAAELLSYNSGEVANATSEQIISSASAPGNLDIGISNTEKKEVKYNFVLVVSVLLVSYLISFLTQKAGYITLLTHRRIWNVLLLITFLVSAILGLMLVMAINYGWFFSVYAFILEWHVEFGTAMAVITTFHLSWHFRYYTCMFRKKDCKPAQKETA